MKYFSHLVFSGSALRSLCLLGILRYIYFNKMDSYIKNVAGTSMGAFFALAFALKIPVDDLEEIILKSINNQELTIIPSSKLINIFTELGFNDPRLYLIGVKEYIKNKYDIDNITFIELSKITGVNLFVSTTKINDGSNIIFNVNTTPNVSVIDTVAASMSIPILTKPILIENAYYVDGCLTNNLPFEIFENVNHENILNVAIYVKSDYEIPEILNDDNNNISCFNYYKQICNIIYANSLYNTYTSKISKFKNPLIIHECAFPSFFKIIIDNDNNMKVNITKDDIENLILQGFTDITEYMLNIEEQEKNKELS